MAIQDRSSGNRPISGRFIPRSLLGRGGMGEVWLCLDPIDDDLVAIKRVDSAESEGPVGQRHLREYQHLTRLRHPSILAVHEYGIDAQDGARWFSSEVLSGPVSTDLAGSCWFPDWLAMARPILQALAFMHRNGWVHGDLKSDNVRLREEACEGQPLEPVLLDFGLCQREGHPSEEKILGTPHAMPPEQWLGERPDARGDIYSMGVLLYQWWCGKLPFQQFDRSSLGRAHLQEDPTPIDDLRPGLPEAARRLIEKMMEKRPDDRPLHAGEVLALLERSFPAEEGECAAESIESLVAQVSYPGIGSELPDLLRQALLQRREVGGTVVHLHRREGDRRKIARRVRTDLMIAGLPVIDLDSTATDHRLQLSRSIPSGCAMMVVKVEDPGAGNPALQEAMQWSEHSGCKLLWWIESPTMPGGYVGSSLANSQPIIVRTDHVLAIGLDHWLEAALPGGSVEPRLHRRLIQWGAGSPSIWERILIGRIRSGELGHDGLRWIWNKSSGHPEDRWRDRVVGECQRLARDDRALLEALAVLGAPASGHAVAKVASIPLGSMPSIAAGLVQHQWIRIDGDLHWREPFQAEGVLVGLDPARRRELHERAASLEGLDPLAVAHHRLSAGQTELAARCLEPWLEDEARVSGDAARLSELLGPLVDLLREPMVPRWAELLGLVEDHLGNSSQRDRAWRISARSQQPGSVASLRLARRRADTSRRDGDPRTALALLEEVVMPTQDDLETRREKTRVAIEHSRILRTLARRGVGTVPQFEMDDSECPDEMINDVRLERCRSALSRGARLQALDLSDQVLADAMRTGHSRHIAEAQCLRARAKEDLRSLRIWSCWHRHLCRQEHRKEVALAAAIEAAESSLRLGEEALVLQEIAPLVDEARQHCRGQLPRALLLLARCEAGAGWIKGASRCLEEALVLDGPAGIVAWEGNLLVAASELAAGRPQTARQILQATPPHRAPHERETIDVHARHIILESRCAFASGLLSQAMSLLDRGLTTLRVRGTDRDLGALRRERVELLDRVGQNALAQNERRKIAAGAIPEPGSDPEPFGMRRARNALDRRRVLLRRHQEEEAHHWLEIAALDALRLRAQPISTWLSLERSAHASLEEKERVARNAWRRVVRLETRHGHASVLFWWAQVREQAGDLDAGQKLRRAAIAEIERWLENAPKGIRWSEMASLLGVSELASGTLSGNGGRNSALA